MVSTIQFVASLHAVAKELREIHGFEVVIELILTVDCADLNYIDYFGS
jgi:hypothetical protein